MSRSPKTLPLSATVSIFQSSKGDSVGYWNLSGNHAENFEKMFAKYVESWLFLNFSKNFEATGKIPTGL